MCANSELSGYFTEHHFMAGDDLRSHGGPASPLVSSEKKGKDLIDKHDPFY